MKLLKLLKKDSINYIYLFLPMVLGYLTVFLCPMTKNAGNNIKFRPPAYVFGIVWPILYLMIGSAWILSKEASFYYLLLSITLSLWIIVYSCYKQKKRASWVLLLSIIITLICYTNSIKQSKLLLCPLLGWLLFALLMNVFEVQLIH